MKIVVSYLLYSHTVQYYVIKSIKLEGRNVGGFPFDSIKIADRNYRMTFAAASLLRT